jgi:hypothetical protein
MNWTTEELGFILYNNRSVDGVVKNFISKKLNPFKLTQIEQRLKISKSKFQSDDRMVEININEINQNSNDVKVTPKDLKELSEEFHLNIGKFSYAEMHFLFDRGINQDVMWKWRLFGLSQIKDKRHLEIIGATVHPTMSKFLEDAIESGGIVIPLFDENENLINCAVRKISIENGESKTLKYTLACPDVPVWGLDQIGEVDEFWITEGIFDTMAIYELGEKSVSCSSAMWSGIQLYQLLEKKPKGIKLFSDNDEVGIRTSAILQDFFNQYDIETKILISKDYKDASELYFLKKMDLSSLKEIEVTDDVINLNKDNSFNFIDHLKNRNF